LQARHLVAMRPQVLLGCSVSNHRTETLPDPKRT